MDTTETTNYTPRIDRATNFGPLTTTFTPPSSCSSTAFWRDDGDPHIFDTCDSGVALVNSDCYPDGWDNEAETRSLGYFSPGNVCPHAWTTACEVDIGVRPAGRSAFLCCPSGWACDDIDDGACTAQTSTVVGTLYDSTDCHSVRRTTDTNVSYFGVDGIMLVTYIEPTSTSDGSEEQETEGRGSGREGSGSGGDGNQDNASGTGGGGLSQPAVIAVATVIPLVFIAICIGVFFLVRKRRKKMSQGQAVATEPSGSNNDWSKPELQGSQEQGSSGWNGGFAAEQELGGRGISEVHGDQTVSPSELSPNPVAPKTYELYSSWGQSGELQSAISNVNSPYELGEGRAHQGVVPLPESPAPQAHEVDGSSAKGSDAASSAGAGSGTQDHKNEVLDGLRSRQVDLARQLKEQEEMIARLERGD